MRRWWIGLALALSVTGAAAAQQPSADEKRAPKTMTLTGCVEKGGGPNQYVVSDELNGKYQVSGSRINRYLGQRVEIAGSPDTGRLRIKGGLYPTPNVAGQAGAIDPARAAVAAMPGGPGSGTGDIDLPALKVKSVKTLGGGCR